MRIFMLGWEFPPFISGGLGTACYGLTKALSGIGADIMFVLPRPVSTPFSTHVRLVSPRPGSPLASPVTEFRLDEFEHVTFRTVDAQLNPYGTPAEYKRSPEILAESEKTPKSVALTMEKSESAGATATAARPAGAAGAQSGAGSHYAGDLFGEVQRYSALATEIA